MGKRIPTFVTAITALFLSACSSVSFFVANLPVSSETRVYEDIFYGNEKWQKLDIYTPKEATRAAPVLVFFYGGRWSFGSKEQYAFAALPFVKQGYIVVIPDYAKYPDVKFPVFVKDAAHAIAWTHDHIAEYGGDKAKLFVSGHSSGAHIGALAVTDPKYLQPFNKDRTIVKAFAGLAGPYDFIPEEDDLKDMFGPPENYPNMQVPNFVDGKEPPMLLLHGADDDVVVLRNLELLRDKIAAKNGKVETKIYKNIDHVKIVAALSWVLDDKAPVSQDMMDFFESQK